MRVDHRYKLVRVHGTTTVMPGPHAGLVTAFIYPGRNPATTGPKQFMVELYGDNRLLGQLAIRHLHDGIATSTIVIVGGIIIGAGALFGYWLHGKHVEEDNRHAEAMQALTQCTYYETEGTTTVKGSGHAAGAHPAGGDGEYSHSSGLQVHRTVAEVAPVGSSAGGAAPGPGPGAGSAAHPAPGRP